MSVFSAEKFQGNRLAIVSVRGNALSQKRKSLIAREFGYSETVFLHDAPGPGRPRLCEIFTETGEEVPFAGHPIIGTAHYIFTYLEKMAYRGPEDRETGQQTAVLQTKAGRIPIFYNIYRQVAACAVPFQFHVHSNQVSLEKVITVQPHVQIVPTIEKVKGRSWPIVSIVKGMSFALVDLTDAPEVLAALQPGQAPEAELDREWSPSFVGCLFYKVVGLAEQDGEPTIHNIQARMISHGIEDPGTGSACSALSCYLALNPRSSAEPKKSEPVSDDSASADPDSEPVEKVVEKVEAKTKDLKIEEKTERMVFGIQQGIEMGRACTIAVEVDVKTDSQGKTSIVNIILSGRGTVFSSGQLLGA
ncbi:hypothetical protein LTR84_010483 [Exophiala bonariae]|uniref:Phenazine biosynthesis-like protein n=1 Tax=Exophiala bonariae TaxID=1690606 RepID=A0AAV9MSY4_9EURO|nr:hypothetical protein LTR84_010483 [Exophiala bonariae]